MTLTLRRNARFSDGTPVDAQAVKASLEATRDASPQGLFGLGPIRSIEVPSKYVVRVTLKTPNPNFVFWMAREGAAGGSIVISPKAIAQWRANPRSPAWSSRTFGAGPYVVLPQETVIGSRCTYVPNKFYYDKSKQPWGKIVFRNISDPNAILAAMRTGELDVAFGSAPTAEAARAAGLTVLPIFGEISQMYFFIETGSRNPVFRDVRVRQAMNYAIDRKKIVSALFGTLARPTSSPSIGLEGNDPKFNDHYPYNPAKARSLLAQAGYPNGFTVKLATVGSWFPCCRTEEHTQAAIKDLAAVGIKVEIDIPVNSQQWLAIFSRRDLDMYSGPSNAVDFLSATPPGRNFNGEFYWKDPVMNQLWLKGLRLQGKALANIRRQLIMRAITQALYVPLLDTATPVFVGKRVKDVRSTIRQAIHPEDWSPA
jgi:peptide/nickel transport system substrate-binding protein